MEDGDGEDPTPFWVQSTTNVRRFDLLLRRVSAAFFSSGLLVFLLLVTAVFFLVFVVPSSISFSAQILKPNSVKKSWDSLNIVLVLVAVVFGFLSRNKNEDRYNSYYDEFQASPANKEIGSHKPSTPNKWYKYNYETNEGSKSNLSNSSHWFDYSDYQAKSEHKNSVFTRNSSSYPDLREISTTHWSLDNDIRVDSGGIWDSEMDRDAGQGKIHRRHRSLGGVEHLRAGAPMQEDVAPNVDDTLLSKSEEGANLLTPEMAAAKISPPETEEDFKMGVSESGDTGLDGSSTELKKDFETLNHVTEPTQPPPAAAEPPELTKGPELTYEIMGRKKERSNRKRNKYVESKDPVSTLPLQTDPSPLSPTRQKSTHRKRAGAAGSSTKDFLNSLYNKKKKKQRQKSIDHLDHLLHEAQAPLSFQVPPPSHPPPPPPAPPPTSVFQNMFSSKKHKRKRTITVTLAPQPPSSPPLHAAPEPEPTSHTAPPTTHKPSKPVKLNSFDKLEEVSNSGSDSSLNRIPPPPPLPPAAFFKSPAWKFVVQGDYVRVNSSNSSRSESPNTYDEESDITPSAMDAAIGASSFHPSPMFCASPDVDTKAESFITNFRATLKLEKIHSMKKRDVGLSGLGPGPVPMAAKFFSVCSKELMIVNIRSWSCQNQNAQVESGVVMVVVTDHVKPKTDK